MEKPLDYFSTWAWIGCRLLSFLVIYSCWSISQSLEQCTHWYLSTQERIINDRNNFIKLLLRFVYIQLSHPFSLSNHGMTITSEQETVWMSSALQLPRSNSKWRKPSGHLHFNTICNAQVTHFQFILTFIVHSAGEIITCIFHPINMRNIEFFKDWNKASSNELCLGCQWNKLMPINVNYLSKNGFRWLQHTWEESSILTLLCPRKSAQTKEMQKSEV